MATYYEVTVKESYEDEKGRVKKKNKKYLVEAVSVTDSEATTVERYKGAMMEFEVVSSKESAIKELILTPKND